jgi:predicted chitinase
MQYRNRSILGLTGKENDSKTLELGKRETAGKLDFVDSPQACCMSLESAFFRTKKIPEVKPNRSK